MRGRISLILLIVLLLIAPVASAMPQVLLLAGSLLVQGGGAAIAWGIGLIVAGTVWGQAEQRKQLRDIQARQRAEYNAGLKARMATVIDTEQPHMYVYGFNVPVGARIIDVLTTGDRDQYHHLVCVHADHESAAILDVEINGKWLGALDANGYVTQGDFLHIFPEDATEYKTGTVFNLAHTPIDDNHLCITYIDSRGDEVSMPFTRVGAQVTVSASHDYTCSYQWQNSIPRVRVIKRLGAPNTPADAVTIAECLAYANAQNPPITPEYTASCTLDGKTATIIRIDLDCPEFQGGVPTIKAKLNGKLLHDMRDPAYPLDTPVCSNNPPLVIADFLHSEMCGVPAETISLTGTALAAASSSLTLPATASEVDDFYKNMTARITAGAGAGQERLVNTSRKNWLKYSGAFDNGAWLKANSPTITTNEGLAPDGVNTYFGIQDLTGTTYKYIYQSSAAIPQNSTATCSFFVGAESSETGYGGISLQFSGGVIKYCYVAVNAVTGAAVNLAGGNITPTITVSAVLGGWRITVTATDSGGNTAAVAYYYATLSINFSTLSSGAGSKRRVWGAQLGPSDSEYIHTEAAAAVGVAVDQPWSSNDYPYSNQFNNAAWGKYNTTITPNATAAPDGSMTADKVVSDVFTGRIGVGFILSCVANQKYTGQFSLKAGEFSTLTLFFDSTACAEGGYYASNVTLDLLTGISSNPAIVSLTDEGNGWWRAALTCTPTGALTYFKACTVPLNSTVGDGVKGFYIAHGQRNAGSVATPYAETGATAIAPPDATSVFLIRDGEGDLPVADFIAAANVCAPITGCTYSKSGITVVVTKAEHGLSVGDVREMQILSGLAISGHYKITAATVDSFTYTENTGLSTSGNLTVAGLYTLNGAVRADQSQGQVLEQMAQAMAGTICATTWSVRAGAWTAPVMALDQSDIVGDFSHSPGSAESDLFNGVKGTYVSAANNYVPTDYKPYQNSVYVAADGGELWTNIDFPFTDDLTRIHNLCRIMVEDQRNAFSVQADFSHKAWGLELGERVTFTSPFLGQTDKIYRIVNHQIGVRQAVSLKVKEDGPTIWDQNDAVVEDDTPNTNLPNPFAIAPLASLTCSSGTAVLLLQADGTIISRILVQWPLATTQAVVHGGLIEIEWKRFGSDIWQKNQASGDATQAYLSPCQDGAFYNLRARTVNAQLNIKSDWVYASHQVIGKTEPPTAVTAITATADRQSITLEWQEIGDLDRKDYLVCDDAGGAQLWNAVAGSGVKLPAASAGTHTYRIKSRDTSNIVSAAEATCQLAISAPSAPVLSAAIKDGMILLSWNDCTTTHRVQNFEVRYGASWAAGTFVGRADAQSLRITPDWTGARTFWVAGIDIAGNYGSPTSIEVTVSLAAAPVLSGAFVGDQVRLSWNKPTSALPIDMYEVRYGTSWAGGTSLGTFKVTGHRVKADWIGGRTFWVAAIDIAGNTGAAGSMGMNVAAAPAPNITTQIIDNNVLLYWNPVSGSLPTVTYELRKGATWAGAALIGTKAGGFTSVFETASGNYTYWVAAIDSAGNYGSPGSVSATVNQPPDYVLQSDYDSTFSGTKSNMVLHGDADGSWIVPVNTTETVAAHFTAHSWATPQAQIDAGYPLYIQPNASPGYYEETKDYGATLASSKITVTLTSAAVTGTVTKTCKISVSPDNINWTDYNDVWTVYATAFRYVKVRITFTAAGTTDLLEVSGLNIRLDSKLKTITKMVSCAAGDTGGTTVYLTDDWTSTGNKVFVDVDAITLTPGSTTAVTPVYDFTDTANPLSLKILLFDNAGARVTGTCSMTVRGF